MNPHERSDQADAHDPDRTAHRDAVRRFVVSSLIALAVVGLATLAVASKLATHEALHDAKVRGESFAGGVAAPLVNKQFREGRPAATSRFDLVMRNRLADGSITHIKVWTLGGELIWSDEPAMGGGGSELPEEVRKQEDTRFSVAHGAPDEETVESDDQLEVYVGTPDEDGRPIIVETYWSAASIDSQYELLLWRLAPLSLGALGVLLVAVLPFGVSLARRLAASNRERSRLLRVALRASELERRRMAQVLHDGVIQDLAGLAYILPAVTPEEDDDEADPELRSTLIEATGLLKADVEELRGMLGELYPRSLDSDGLGAALQDLATGAGRRGIEVTLDNDHLEHEDLTRASLVYRVVREGLLNVIHHSGAHRAEVSVRRVPPSATLVTVTDDGRNGAAHIPAADSGHLGLRILHDAVKDLGGTLTVGPAPEGGTELRALLP
jgi:two-component system, NarL family, sensor kinase